MTTLLQVKGIQKSYLKRKILEEISLEVRSGVFYALLGKNGAGKSTLMRILMRHEAPDEGEGIVLGKPFSGDDQSMNDQIGYVSENLEFHTRDSIGVFFKNFGEFYSNWSDGIFSGFLKRFQVDPNQQYLALSRGQKMQVAFAAAAAIQPKIFFLDEITAVLDASARAWVMAYLGIFCKNGGSVVMATNIVSEVENFAEHLWLIENQKIQLDAPLDAVKKQYIKLRKQVTDLQPFFDTAQCVTVGLNSDGSESFVAPRMLFEQARLSPDFVDRRGITSEEIFIYFTREQKIQ